MKIRAKLSICGLVNMRPQEEKTVSDETAEKLIAAGYAEAVEEPATTTAPPESEPEEPTAPSGAEQEASKEPTAPPESGPEASAETPKKRTKKNEGK